MSTRGVRAEVLVPGRLDLALEAEAGETLAVIGPNGAGKTTLLDALAGLTPMSGSVTVAGRDWSTLPVRERRVGMVFQSRLLFPHLSALDNVAFGLRSRGTDRRTADAAARTWLERLGVGALADRRPRELSGGQAQRVAIARALAPEPDLLLLDEPMAALDIRVATSLRIELAEHLAGFTGVAVLVTHDALDALTLADRVLVLDEGRVAQVGTPADVSTHPRTDHVARLVGLNVLRGQSSGSEIGLADGRVVHTTTPFDGPAFAAFPPTAVTVTTDRPTGSARNRWPGRIRGLASHGTSVRVHVDVGDDLIADVTPGAAAELRLDAGREVWVSVKATEVTVYGAGTEYPAAPLPSRHV